MGFYDEQIRERKEYDDLALEMAYGKITDAILGKKHSNRFETTDARIDSAIEVLLKYFHVNNKSKLENVKGLDDKLENALNPNGIMRRRIRLTKGWYKDAYGPFITSIRDTDEIVAIIPGKFGGYYYYNANTGKYVRINSANEGIFDEDAYSFYRPFPIRKMSIADLFIYMKNVISPEDITVILLLLLVTTLLGMLTPKFTGLLYGSVVKFKSVKLLIAVGVFMITSTISRIIVNSMKAFGFSRLTTKVSINVEAATMMRVISLQPSFFKKYTSGELSRITGYVNNLCNLLIGTFLSTSLTSLFSLLYIFQIFNYARALVVPAILVVCASTIFNIFIAMANMKRSKKIMQYSAKATGLGYALLSGLEKIKLSGAEKRAFAKWADCYSKEAKLEYNPPFVLKISSVIVQSITMLGTIIMYFLTIKNGIDISEYTAFMSAYGLMTGAFGGLSSIVLQVANIKPSLEMCRPILEAVPEMSENKEVLNTVNGNISIDNITFRYDEESPYIFENFSLKIKKGEYLAIVGKTGCGKSTLLRLMLGFEKPERGAIYIDGRDINSVDIKSLRRHIGTVIQNGKVFQGSIFDNIAVAASDVTLDDAWKAAEIAGLDEDIKSMPMGMNTMISEGQGGISGGQKQRLMIARAVVNNPKVLIMDEATSALDNITQKKVTDALDKLKCTRIIIAHRLSTIRECDRIVVIDEGKIVEEGTFDELLANDGFFKELVERQMA